MSQPESTEETEAKKSDFLERLKRHWFGGLVLLTLAVAGTTWKVAEQLMVKPRDFEIETLKRRLGDIPSEVTIGYPVRITSGEGEGAYEVTVLDASVKLGQSMISADSGLVVKVERIDGDRVDLGGALLPSNNPIDIRGMTTTTTMLVGGAKHLLMPAGYRVVIVSIEEDKAHIVVFRLSTDPTEATGKKKNPSS